MNIPAKIFKSYDIRGIYPGEINEENIAPIIRAIYKFIKDKQDAQHPLSIVLGRDMRLSSPSLFAKATTVLIELGVNVIDIGISSTPSVYFSVFYYGYDAGIQISASHNPKEYNGLKIVMRGEKGLIKIGKSTGMDDIKNMSIEGVEIKPATGGKITKKEGVLEDEVNNALNILKHPKINKFKIVADAANAMGAPYIEALFKVIDADLIKMNFELDGNFPSHQADPLQADTLVDLQKRVVAEGADFGMAPDGDGDRLFFIDEKGTIVPPSIITAVVARELLKNNKGEKILYDIRYILTPKKIIEENGGESVITKVGHAFITEKLNEVGGIFAGESSGHYFFRSTGNAESQLPIIITVLKVMTDEGRKLSEIVEELRRSYESGEINFKVNNASEIIETMKNKFGDGEISTLDGVAISYPEWRMSLRTSNTEPLLRLNVEANDKELLEKNKELVLNIIKETAKND